MSDLYEFELRLPPITLSVSSRRGSVLPMRSIPWQSLVNCYHDGLPALDSEVLGTLLHPNVGRRFLRRDGAIEVWPADNVPQRVFFMTLGRLHTIRAKRAEIALPNPGFKGISFRFAQSDEAAPVNPSEGRRYV